MDERGEAAGAVHGRRDDFRLQPLLLDTARVLMLLGVATIFSAGFDSPAASATPTQALVGLLLWLLGVCLLVLVPVAAGRFLQLQAALAVAAAMAVAVLKHLLALSN
ncbi:hypothetical protein BDA96_10G293100 [Sorghum bicolor]|uniref:Uncharacterized protein n=2 Tax=Sorghum bicolor TaxID=4558 RepID=A0A921U2E3_SORBI|nr:uncharacterized protein LOC110430727 [Sorghum bicolor]KAG0515608.1 hypothetical protein BDA96_10G293100 [Sorghum bicolor]KXG20606.1 hypothetical protein SORBI_3010G226100 [Sorghum bicolor]|eukprot:XP_021304268.1 uncharacterized protein LOC110430727 [Sorghum bicolor]